MTASIGAEILNEASMRDNLLRFYTKMYTNEVAQEIVDNVAINVRPPEANKLGDDILMQESNREQLLSDLVGDLDFERVLNG